MLAGWDPSPQNGAAHVQGRSSHLNPLNLEDLLQTSGSLASRDWGSHFLRRCHSVHEKEREWGRAKGMFWNL